MRVGQYVVVIFLLSIEVKGDIVNEPVRLKEGDPGAHLRNISKIKPYGRWTLEKNGSVVLILCSPKEERRGCKNKTSPRFSILTLEDKYVIVLHNVTESDAGRYVFQGSGDKEEPFNVTVEKTTRRTETESPNTSSTSKALAICLPIFAVVLLLLLFYFKNKIKEKITIWLKRVQETLCGMFAKSSERDETSTDSVITNDNENPQNLQLLLLSDVNTSSPHDITVC